MHIPFFMFLLSGVDKSWQNGSVRRIPISSSEQTNINFAAFFFIASLGPGPGMPAAPSANQFPVPSPMGFAVKCQLQ